MFFIFWFTKAGIVMLFACYNNKVFLKDKYCCEFCNKLYFFPLQEHTLLLSEHHTHMGRKHNHYWFLQSPETVMRQVYLFQCFCCLCVQSSVFKCVKGGKKVRLLWKEMCFWDVQSRGWAERLALAVADRAVQQLPVISQANPVSRCWSCQRETHLKYKTTQAVKVVKPKSSQEITLNLQNYLETNTLRDLFVIKIRSISRINSLNCNIIYIQKDSCVCLFFYLKNYFFYSSNHLQIAQIFTTVN